MTPVADSCGGRCFRMASKNFIASLSRQAGSLAGVLGSSGKQVHPFVPAASCAGEAVSLVGQSSTVAPLPISSGAALRAFSIFHSGVPGAGPTGDWAGGGASFLAQAIASTHASSAAR